MADEEKKDSVGSRAGSRPGQAKAASKKKASSKKKAASKKKASARKKTASKKKVVAKKVVSDAFGSESASKTDRQDKVREKLEDMGVMRNADEAPASTSQSSDGLNLKVEFIFVALLILFLVVFLAVFGGDSKTAPESVVQEEQETAGDEAGPAMSNLPGQGGELVVGKEVLAPAEGEYPPVHEPLMTTGAEDSFRPMGVPAEAGSSVEQGVQTPADTGPETQSVPAVQPQPAYPDPFSGAPGYGPAPGYPPQGYMPPEYPAEQGEEGSAQAPAASQMPAYPPRGYAPYPRPWGMPYQPAPYPGAYPGNIPPPGWQW